MNEATWATDTSTTWFGSKRYRDYCAFGHRVDRWLHGAGAARLFDAVEANGEDVDA